jgi:ribosomal-protein-alanine N-acetyltransferase
MSAQIPTIQTGRLTLRGLQPGDAGRLLEIFQTEGMLRYFPGPGTAGPERIERFITRQQEHWQKYGYGNWGIVPPGEEQVAGWVGLQFVPELDETEVGFMVDKALWGRGYATEAGRASLRFGFEHFDLEHIIALVHPENLASRRVIEKCGLAFVETLQLWGMELMRHRIERAGMPAETP